MFSFFTSIICFSTDLALIFFCVSAIGLAVGGLPASAHDFAVEVTYPLSPNHSTQILHLFCNFFTFVLTFLCSWWIENEGLQGAYKSYIAMPIVAFIGFLVIIPVS